MGKMIQDQKLRDMVMRALAECSYEFSNAPEEDQPVIIDRWTTNLYALIYTMIKHDKSTTKKGSK